mmetsp:Transcript_24634/g.52271  ORF Transcript_24634/g.52271 Transcript_24634/m.52271 type:complete len:255 (+) Transcript_24634:82-846(+)
MQTMGKDLSSSCIAAPLLVRRPQGQVIAQQLHDEGGVLVRVLGHVIKLRNRILERRARHLACFVRVGQHLVLENGVVQRKAEADGVCYRQVLLRHLRCLFIRQSGILGRLALRVTIAELRDVAVVVGLHLLVEDLRFTLGRLRDQISVQEAQDGVANLLKLAFDFLAVLLCIFGVLLVALRLLLLLDARDDAPSSAAAADGILIGHGQEIALLNRELFGQLADGLHVIRHLVIPLCLLCQLCEVDLLVAIGHCV